MVVDAEMKSNAKPKGKASGTKNFQPLEDINITKAYKEITTDAAIGTDQEGALIILVSANASKNSWAAT